MDSHVTWTIDPETGAQMPVFDRAVTSEPLREYIRGVITNGVLPNPSTNLQVSAGTNGMTVVVQAGFCVIEGGLAIEPNTRTLEVTSADSTYDRIDTVVARWDANDASRKVDLHIRAGVPASSPVRPTLTREGSIYELGLADVFVTKNVATITNEKITDTRYESARCGICSSIAEWDTTTIYQQVQADLRQFKSSEQTAFMEWFDQMKDQLSEDAAGHLQAEVDGINKKIHTNLLNPTLGTTTVNGVTCTNNGDGTYTLSGTATNDVLFVVRTAIDTLELPKTYKLVGCPSGGGDSTFELNTVKIVGTSRSVFATDRGNGATIEYVSGATYEVRIRIANNAVLDNVTFKPMLTTDTSATYDDFVQYSGNGEINANVAEIFNKVEEHETRLDSDEATIGDHTSTLEIHTSQIEQIVSDFSSLTSGTLTVLGHVSKTYWNSVLCGKHIACAYISVDITGVDDGGYHFFQVPNNTRPSVEQPIIGISRNDGIARQFSIRPDGVIRNGEGVPSGTYYFEMTWLF